MERLLEGDDDNVDKPQEEVGENDDFSTVKDGVTILLNPSIIVAMDKSNTPEKLREREDTNIMIINKEARKYLVQSVIR